MFFQKNTSQILFIAYFPVPVIFARYSISGILATFILYTISDFFFLYSLSKISMCDKNQLILHHLGFFWCEKFFYWDVSLLYTYLCERNNNPSAWDNFLICILGQFWIKRPHHFFGKFFILDYLDSIEWRYHFFKRKISIRISNIEDPPPHIDYLPKYGFMTRVI